MYVFLVVVFIIVKGLLVLVIVLNLFCVVYFGKLVNFGFYDWKLYLFILGILLMEVLLVVFLNKFGFIGLL